MSNAKRLRPFYVFNRLMNETSNFWFRQISRTPPIQADPSSDVILFSILQKKDVNAYLLAAKSFLRYCPPMNIVVQSDGSLDHESCQKIRAHLPHVSIISRSSTEELVRSQISKELLRLIGETNWFVELKLLNPILRFPDRYVILFDSDLLFMRRPGIAIESIQSTPQRTFYCPGGNVLAQPFHDSGLKFPRVDIRSFNSGFVGFFNSIDIRMLEPIAEAIRKHDPNLFKVWDIEQALWSVILNETHSPQNLKSADSKYVGSGWSTFESLQNESTMAHFVGAKRFRNLMYLRLARKVIRELH